MGNMRTFTSHSGDSPERSLTSVHHRRLPCRPWPASSNHCNWRERRAGTHRPTLPSLTCKHCAIPSNATNYHPAQLPGLNLWLRRTGMSADSAPAELFTPRARDADFAATGGCLTPSRVRMPSTSLTFPRH